MGHPRAPSEAHPGHSIWWRRWQRSRYSASRAMAVYDPALKPVKWMGLGGEGGVGVGQFMRWARAVRRVGWR